MLNVRSNPIALTFIWIWVLVSGSLCGQSTIEIGTGTILNQPFQAPSPYSNINPGARHQLLFLAGELQAAGMNVGTIHGIGFNLFQTSGAIFQGFTVSMGTTSASALTDTWETGLMAAWGPQVYSENLGWTEHVFDTPFFWDGTSNVVVETCYYNGNSTQNAQVYQSPTAFVSTVSRNTPNPAVCTDLGGTHVTWEQRPNIRFSWLGAEIPPVALPVANPAYSCTGTINFAAQNSNSTDVWEWDLGDGNTANTEQVEHTYAASGSYTVQLIAINAFGSDTAEITVTVDLDAVPPIPACDAASTGTVEGFGILEVGIDGMFFASGDAVSEGYVDNSCQAITVIQGTEMDLVVTTGTTSSHAVRAWLDLDGSGTFSANEMVLSGTGPTIATSTLIGSGAVLNTPLRLRVIAAYDLVTPNPAPCGTVQFGQAEDYSIMVIENIEPPVASFTASPLLSCSGTIQFTDHSLNIPTAWSWSFGDGGSSEDQHPVHEYLASGTYTVMLTAINANGEDIAAITDYITIDLESQLVAAGCTPNTQSFCCGYGILGFQFAGINNSSPNATEGYRDRSCGNVAEVTEGQAYPWTVMTDPAAPAHDVRIWIDMNNDGSFTSNELVATALDAISPSGTMTIPAGTVFDQALRLRIQADVIGQSVGPCDAPLLGQVEDMAVIIAQNTTPPTASFSASPLITCDGTVQFTDLSLNAPDAWNWNFGDGTSSIEQDPAHTYTETGSFTVTLTTTNAFGSDTETLSIIFALSWQCDTLQVQGQGNQTNTACVGILADDGGPNANYQPGNSGAFTISPVGAVRVALQFSQFQWGNNNNRVLAVYDGPTVNSPLIDTYTGNGLNQIPNNGLIVSTGPSITIRQEQSGGGGGPFTAAGFLLTWNCSQTGIAETNADPIRSIHPVPADDWFTIELAPGHETRRLELYNATGQLVLQRSFTSTVLKIDAGELPAGLYAVQVITDRDRWVRNLIIN